MTTHSNRPESGERVYTHGEESLRMYEAAQRAIEETKVLLKDVSRLGVKARDSDK